MVLHPQLERAFEAARESAHRAGEIERRYFRSDDFEVENKADDTPVTIADREAEAAIREVLASRTPDFGVVGEELGTSGNNERRWIVDPLDATANFVAGIPLFAVLLGLELEGELVLGFVHAPAWGPSGASWWAIRGHGAFACEGLPAGPQSGTRLATSATNSLAAARIAHGGLEVIQKSPLRERFPLLVDQVARTRGFGDWWGHCLVAEGRVDAMVEGAVAYHDVAAIVPLIQEAGGRIALPRGAHLAPGYNQSFVSINGALPIELEEKLFS